MPQYGKWIPIGEPLGSGGQGKAYCAVCIDDVLFNDGGKHIAKFTALISRLGPDKGMVGDPIKYRDDQLATQTELVHFITQFKSHLRVIKILHEGGANPHDIARLKKEIAALMAIQHPNLLPIHDFNLDEGWYVTDIYESGSLFDAKNAVPFKGQALLTLKAVLPLVRALKVMHESKIIHRDIKTQNIFVKSDGGMVLGDLGLVFMQDAESRVTLSDETVGSRDWMPFWLVGENLSSEEIQPFFDIVGIAKVIYCLIAGEKYLPLNKTHRSENIKKVSFDLEKRFPDKPEMRSINELLDQCIVMTDEECKLRDTETMITAVEAAIAKIEFDGRIFSSPRNWLCRVCRIGRYEQIGQGPAPNLEPSDRIWLRNFGLEPRGQNGFAVFVTAVQDRPEPGHGGDSFPVRLHFTPSPTPCWAVL